MQKLQFHKYFKAFYSSAIWLLFIGMMWSRAILSIGVVAFPALSLLFMQKGDFHRYFKSRIIRGTWLLFLLASISLLWTSDVASGLDALMNKTMFFLLPLFFFLMPIENAKWRIITLWGIAIIHAIPMLESIWLFFQDINKWMEVYNEMGTLSIASYDDHIRFTLSLILLNLLLAKEYIYDRTAIINKYGKKAFIAFSLFSFLFLHFIASKSGIVLLYISLFACIVTYLKSWKKKMVFSGILFSIIVGMFYISPTFRKKADMLKYQWETYQDTNYLNYNNSEEGRIISYKLAWYNIQENLLLGTGIGTEKNKMQEKYILYFPEIPENNHLIPHNQFLFSVLSMGIIFGTLFLLLFFGIFIDSKSKRFNIRNLIVFVIFVSFFPEANLESQFGIFICTFYLLWVKNNNVPKNQENTKII